MKKIKYLFLVIPFIMLLSSCDFIKYVHDDSLSSIDNNEEKLIETQKKNYIDKLDSLSSASLYNEEERKFYINYLVEARAEINESVSIEEIKEIFETFKALILSLKTTEDINIDLLNEKSKYIDLLNNILSLDDFREKEQQLYSFYLETGIKAIQDETNISNVESLFKAYKEAIESIKTNNQYLEDEENALSKYKVDNIDIIEKYIDITLYREIESKSIKILLEEYKKLINQSLDEKSIDNLVLDYKIKVYSFKTDDELYSEELTILINNSLKEIDDYKNKVDYRDNERNILLSIITSFHNQVALCQTKESVNQLLTTYKEMIDSIKTDKELYEAERIDLINESYIELLSLVDLNGMNEEAKEDYLDYCDKVKNEMLLMTTKELIKSRLLNEKKNMYSIGAQLGDDHCLRELQDVLVEDLNNYLVMDLYRYEQQAEIYTIIINQGKLIKTANNYDETLNCVDNAHALLDAVLTNNQMWNKEDEEFFSTLHQLYGNDILTPPSSMTEANDYFELANIIDYYAFYQIDAESFIRDRFRVKLNFEASNLYDAVWEYSELISYTLNYEVTYEEEYAVFLLIASDFANKSNPKVYTKIDNLVYYNSVAADVRDANFDSFSYKNNKKLIIWNSQQMWYGLEHDYYVKPIAGSVADELIQTSEIILKSIILNDMDEYEKVFAIHNWFTNNITYDEYARNDYTYESRINLKSWYVEGALLDRIAVCAGFAKAYLSLLKMEGIDCYLCPERVDRDTYHEKVIILIDGKKFDSDITFDGRREFSTYRYTFINDEHDYSFYDKLYYANASIKLNIDDDNFYSYISDLLNNFISDESLNDKSFSLLIQNEKKKNFDWDLINCNGNFGYYWSPIYDDNKDLQEITFYK